MEGLSKTIYVKHIFTQEEILSLAQRMARAEATIAEKLDALKSMQASMKAEVTEQEGVLHVCAERLRSGYEMRPVETNVKYESGLVKYLDKETGEILEERLLTPEEQLEMTAKRTDAEDIIRQARKEEVESL